MYVTIEYRDPGDRRKGRVVGIHDSAERAQKLIETESLDKMEVLQWPNRQPPQLGAAVVVADRQIVPDRPNGLLSLLEAALKRQDLEKLRQENAALARHNSRLQSLVEDKEKSYSTQFERDRTNSQFKDLWISSTVQEALANLLADFTRAEVPTLNKRIMLVPDAENVTRFNRLAQENRMHAGSFDATQGLAYNNVLLHSGDRVQFHRTDETLGVKDADLGEIVELFPEQRTAVVVLDRWESSISEVIFVPLRDYSDLDLGYAATYSRAADLQLHQAFILAGDSARELTDSLSARNVEIYADRLTACLQFPELAGEQQIGQAIDMEADPLAHYRTRD